MAVSDSQRNEECGYHRTDGSVLSGEGRGRRPLGAGRKVKSWWVQTTHLHFNMSANRWQDVHQAVLTGVALPFLYGIPRGANQVAVYSMAQDTGATT